ncbi:MAG: hypothetical protein ACK42A_04505 [Pyrinomonadaceae bacterium]|jgi:hypothetical protein
MTFQKLASFDEIFVGFELSVLHRLDFQSIAIPITVDPYIGVFLKRRGISVSTNDLSQADWHRAIATVQNSTEILEPSDIDLILEDAYEPQTHLSNSALEIYFSTIDAIWFDNVRRHLDSLKSNLKFAIAADIVFRVGKYLQSFGTENAHLRRPLSKIFLELHSKMEPPINSAIAARSSCMQPQDFIAESGGHIMLLRLNQLLAAGINKQDWRDVWLRGSESKADKSSFENFTSRSGFLQYLADLLDRASHFRTWALSFCDNGLLNAEELVEIVGKFRKVEAIYTKDFSELTGQKAKIIVA